MLFNSVEFIFAYLPISLMGYFGLNRLRLTLAVKTWLVLCSLFFLQLLLATLPLLNIAHSGLSRETLTQPRALYQLDPLIPMLSRWLLPLGISPFATQVIGGQQE